jgi:peptide/nickel transport system substrate-binding protein
MRRLLAAVTSAGLAMLLAATPGNSRTSKQVGTFLVGIPATNFGAIDAILGGGVGGVFEATCAGLVTTPDKPLPVGLRIVPEIAADYPEITNRGKTYAFRLRKEFRFSTGARVTARDFAHTINRLLNPAMQSPFVQDLSSIVGAQAVIDGKARNASGVIARGDSITIRLRKPMSGFLSRLRNDLCVVPASVPIDPEGAKAPIPSAAPYYVSEYVPNERVVLERNRFYRGERPHHVDRFLVDLSADIPTVLDRVDRGELDFGWVPNNSFGTRAEELKQKYGVNRSRFFVEPDTFLRMFVLNTAMPLFRNNAALRQAVNFAIDRKALQRERGGTLAGTLTDQYLPPGLPAYRNVNIYPLRGPDLRKARALAKGNTRNGKAVLYAPASPLGAAQAQIVQSNLKQIGLEVEIKRFPNLFDKLATPGEPFDIGWIGWNFGTGPDPASILNFLFDGTTIGQPGFGNWSYFNSSKYNHRLDDASRLPAGPARNRAYQDLDIDLTRDAAPGIAYSYDNRFTVVGPRTDCVVVNPGLDLAAVCLK